MGYAISLSPRAANKLATVPRALLDDVEAEMGKLALDPKKLGRKTVSPPFPETIEHIYHYHLRHEEEMHYFTVFFCTLMTIRRCTSPISLSVLPSPAAKLSRNS